MTERSELPDQLPQLRAGTHMDAAEGACLMEYASLLAGEPWSDHPRCTHPVLAALARLVNDATSPEVRGELAVLVPAVVGARQDHPRVAPAVIAAALGSAAESGAVGRALHRHQRRALRRLAARSCREPSTVSARFADRLYQRGPAMHALVAAVRAVQRLPTPARDAALRAALMAGIDAAHTATPKTPANAHRREPATAD